MKSLISCLVAVTFISACASDDQDIWYPSEDPGGKADAFSTVKGSDIPSAHVDATKSYLLSRTIETLQTVGALDMVEARLAARVDGIIANMPADGKLHLAELVRMEDPGIHASLFPDEVAALPRLWKKVEAPSTNHSLVGPDLSFAALDTAVAPGPAVPPSALGVATLATNLQAPAARLQNVFDADGNTTTVMIADLDKGLASPGAFTPAEVAAFGTIKALFREKAVAQASAQLAVSPKPGPFAITASVGPITLRMEGTTRYDEDRQLVNTKLTTRLTAAQTQTVTAALPAGAKLVVIEKAIVGEVVSEGGVLALTGGSYIFEVWQAGQRTFATNVLAPALTRTQTLELGDKLDYTLVAGLTPLVRNLATATMTGANATSHFTFDATAIAPTTPINQNGVRFTATPIVTLPIGRYTVQTQGAAVLLVYPNNVLWLVRGSTTYRMLPSGNNNVPVGFFSAAPGASFDAPSNVLKINGVSFALTASMRDI